MDGFSIIGIGISAFVATNIDDIFVLMLFYANSKFKPFQIVLGQYLGIGLLVSISTIGSLLALVIPNYIIGLLGLVPISIGLVRLIQLRRHNNNPIPIEETQSDSKWQHVPILTVAAVTFSNGGDNIGIYTPLFAKYHSLTEAFLLSTIFMVMTAIWCSIAYYLTNHPLIANRLKKVGHVLFPCVLIGLGIYILFSSFLQSY